jgi:hypothetical protein
MNTGIPDSIQRQSWRDVHPIHVHLLDLRDQLERRRRRLLDELDELMADELRGRVGWSHRNELVDQIERLLQDADAMLLREFNRNGGGIRPRDVSFQSKLLKSSECAGVPAPAVGVAHGPHCH